MRSTNEAMAEVSRRITHCCSHVCCSTGTASGVTNSRAIEKATYNNVAFRYLVTDQHPDHDTIVNFRREHLQALAGLFVSAAISSGPAAIQSRCSRKEPALRHRPKPP
jgi:hypothetical protein